MITQLARVYSGSMSGNGTCNVCKGRKSLREGASAEADQWRSVHPHWHESARARKPQP